MRLDDRTALITGAARGIGFSIAKTFAREGARLVLFGRDGTRLEAAAAALRDSGAAVLPLTVDVANEAAVIGAFKTAADFFGGIDILVNNAAINPNRGRPVMETTTADWDHVMAVNLRGPFLCAKAAIPLMRAHGRGWIINIGSIASRVIRDGNNSAYRTSKFALRGLCWALAKDLREDNIAVSAIFPGTTRTAMVTNEAGDQTGWLDPEDVAEAALFLATRRTDVVIPEITISPRSAIAGLSCPYA
jgi:NAD(P)-dependent dehydrogenase (short-subunit alcohol dehydrogenase family)